MCLVVKQLPVQYCDVCGCNADDKPHPNRINKAYENTYLYDCSAVCCSRIRGNVGVQYAVGGFELHGNYICSDYSGWGMVFP